jgi:non-ribosomal peptide synthetase component F
MTAEDEFVVVVNRHGQHALWPADLDRPAGWRGRSAAMSRRACLDAIAGTWRDIAPAGVRAAATAAAGVGVRAAGAAGVAGQPAPAGHDAGFVHELFAGQASRRPGATAVITAGTRLTYRELDESANRLARYLADLGAGPETLVGVHLERGAEAIRSLLAIMKAGSGYLPLDPSLPPDRLDRICAETRPMAILTGRAGKQFPGTGVRLLPLAELTADLARQPPTAPGVRPHPDTLCYAIHTSGSTGRPKAVAVSYAALACVISELAGEYRMSARDRVLQLASVAFDTSVEQALVTLACGATLMLPSAGTIAPADLLRYLEHQQVTVMDLTPAYWHRLLVLTGPDDERLRSVRLMITGGEMADPADCRAALRRRPGRGC